MYVQVNVKDKLKVTCVVFFQWNGLRISLIHNNITNGILY